MRFKPPTATTPLLQVVITTSIQAHLCPVLACATSFFLPFKNSRGINLANSKAFKNGTRIVSLKITVIWQSNKR
ncbi:hypothetical protein E2C01_036218 [Portunus trituberculatus]|uniref:Uncharacterized protein n=1 Tax=Portunus trituberculatus TaxID=210409 RepID=A0A5B7FAR8_PORTR|nr:hypothetical protein [Portunus trituberculatus]